MKMKSKGCGTKKYANGGKKKSKTVTVSPTGKYKTVIKTTSKNGNTTTKRAIKRTIKGVLSGAPSTKKINSMIAKKIQSITAPPSPTPPTFPSFMSPDSVNNYKARPKSSTKSKLGPVATELNKLAKGGKMKTKKYAMGGLSQQCDPRDGSCKTVRKAGLLKRWVQNAQNRRLSNFSKKKFKR